MKQLTLLRHAKSCWENDLPDFERPLNKRGLRNAPVMAERLKGRKCHPDLALVSPAKRALETARIILPAMGLEDKRILLKKRIYEAGSKMLFDLVRETDNNCGHLLLVGHNPSFTDLWNILAREKVLNIPTCGAFSLKFPGLQSWCELEPASGKTVFMDYPKKKD
jgi:phosphohistidine phosphatase